MVAAPGKFDAFISYSHEPADLVIAEALQSELEGFARPWYRPRLLRIFRDQTNLSASPELWTSILAGLESSSWFILVASPASAASPWVGREVQWWLDHRGPQRMLVALAGGELVWSGDGFDTARSTALSPDLARSFAKEPFWIDLRKARVTGADGRPVKPRLGDVVAEFAAPIRGVEKDTIVGEHVRRRKQARRLVQGVVASLTALTIVASVASWIAVSQRNTAVEQTRHAVARQLAATAQSLTGTHLDLAQLFAVQGYQLDPTATTRAALLSTLTANPHLAGYLDAGGKVVAVDGSDDGSTVVSGTVDGLVRTWELPQRRPHDLGNLGGQIFNAGLSADGHVVAATTSKRAAYWVDGARHDVELPAGYAPAAINVSPAGKVVAVAATTDTAAIVRLISVGDGTAATAKTVFQYPTWVMVRDDTTFAVSSRILTERHDRAADLDSVTVSSDNGLPIDGGDASALSRDGAIFGYSKAGGITLWPTDTAHPTSPELRGFESTELYANPEAMAIGTGAKQVAVARAGTIFVFSLDSTGKPVDQPIRLTGNDYTASQMTFYNHDHGLVSGHDSALVLWRLDDGGLLTSSEPLRLGFSCNACGAPTIAAHGDGDGMVVTSGNGATVLRDPDGGLPVPASYGPPVWTPQGKVLVPTRNGGVDVLSGADGTVEAHWPVSKTEAFGPVAAVLNPDGTRYAVIEDNGSIQVRDGRTGAVQHTLPHPAGFGKDYSLPPSRAAINRDVTTAVAVGETTVVVTDLITGEQHDFARSEISAAAFAGDRLLMRRFSGALEFVDPGSGQVLSAYAGDAGALGVLATSPDGSMLAQQRSNGAVVLLDLTVGRELGSFQIGQAGVLVGAIGLSFSPDGDALYAAYEAIDGVTGGRLWTIDLRPATWTDMACQSAGRPLDAAMWRQFIDPEPPADLACSHD